MELLRPSDIYDLSGQVAVVTGAAQGMGLEISWLLAGAGAAVAILDINLPDAEKVAQDIVDAGGKAQAFHLDQAQEKSVVEVISTVRDQMGGLHILVNNAGIQDRAAIEDISVEFWDRVIDTNLRGPFLCMREAARIMRADKVAGRIVSISSIAAVQACVRGLTAYAAAKSGVVALTRNFAYELATERITVNAVLPAGVDTPGARSSKGTILSDRELARQRSLLGRTGKSIDVANAVLFFVTPTAEFITGQTLLVDGGIMIS